MRNLKIKIWFREERQRIRAMLDPKFNITSEDEEDDDVEELARRQADAAKEVEETRAEVRSEEEEATENDGEVQASNISQRDKEENTVETNCKWFFLLFWLLNCVNNVG